MVSIMKSSSKDILDEIIHIYDDLRNNNIILVHHGAFTQDIILSLLSLTKERLMFVRDKKIVRKKLLNVLIECLQNITRHASREDLDGDYASILLIGSNEENYFVITGNVINNKEKEALTKKIEKINLMDPEGLNELYRDIISQGNFSEKGGAGLGLIDMAKRSGQKLQYSFNSMEKELTFFTLETNIKRALNEQ